MTKPTAYIIAQSMRHAHLTAEIDWKWERISAQDYRTPSGEIVRVISNPIQLRGCPKNTRVYMGFGWYDRPRYEKAMLDDMVASNQIKLVENEKAA